MSTIKFDVILQSQPEKYYLKTDKKTSKLLESCFLELELNPFYKPSKIKRLYHERGLFRYRVGNLRIIYEIFAEKHIVNIVAILPRGDVYKKI